MLVLSPWNEPPNALSRCWCLYELYLTATAIITTNNNTNTNNNDNQDSTTKNTRRFEIAMDASQQRSLLADVRTGGYVMKQALLQDIDIETR